jgi:hypothetical protein
MIAEQFEYKNRTADTFQYCQQIRQNLGLLEHVLTWCKNECQSEWRWQMIESSSPHDPGLYCFYFDSDRDACAFALRWS